MSFRIFNGTYLDFLMRILIFILFLIPSYLSSQAYVDSVFEFDVGDEFHYKLEREVGSSKRYGYTRNKIITKTITLYGWVDTIRDHGHLLFVHLRDRSGVIQLVFDPETQRNADTVGQSLRNEYVIEVHGTVRARTDDTINPNLPTGYIEVDVTELTLLSESETPPFMITEKDIEEGFNPFLIVASAGTTDTGAIDPLQEISVIAKKTEMWFHVDAAYGGFFILTDSRKNRFKGIENADSLVIDPHKGLFIPYGLGAVLIKDKEAVFHSQHYTANYMQDATQENSIINPADVSPELTKHFRGLRMWLPLKLHGIKPFVACLEEKLYLTQYFRERLLKQGFEIGPEPDLSVSYFWYPSMGDQNEFNRNLMSEIHKDGRVFLSSTEINSKFVIRMAILSFRTKIHTIDKAMEMILDAKKKVESGI